MIYDPRGLKVVIAESDRTVLELLQIRLDVAGYHTCVARTGRAALDILKTIRPAAMVLDLNLPDMDGFQVLHLMNPRAEKPQFPTLVVGRKLSIDDIKRAVDLGARDCMAKPFSGADVLERVSRMLKAPAATPRQVAYV